MFKKIKFAAILVVFAMILITSLYVKGENIQADQNNTEIAVEDQPSINQKMLRDIDKLMTADEKAYHLNSFNTADNRPAKRERVKVKGIYMSGAVFNSQRLFNNLVDLVDTTELNALVIDMKDDMGYLTAPLEIPVSQEIKARTHRGANIQENMKLLYEKNIYPIARIVVFKDPTLAAGKTDLAIKNSDGLLWRDRKGLAWVDPHNKEVWKYAVDVAKEAAKHGFREIQFDYVRFPTDGNVKNAIYPFATGQSKEDVILDFLTYAKKELEEYNVFIAADVFGLTTLTSDDMGMGQKYEKVITQVDYICPMVYPSHYGPGNYGFANPNAYPYEVVKNALLDGLKKAGSTEVIIRPWLQDFNLGKPRYGSSEVLAQIKATYDAGLEEWILWNAGNRYTKDALVEE